VDALLFCEWPVINKATNLQTAKGPTWTRRTPVCTLTNKKKKKKKKRKRGKRGEWSVSNGAVERMRWEREKDAIYGRSIWFTSCLRWDVRKSVAGKSIKIPQITARVCVCLCVSCRMSWKVTSFQSGILVVHTHTHTNLDVFSTTIQPLSSPS